MRVALEAALAAAAERDRQLLEARAEAQRGAAAMAALEAAAARREDEMRELRAEVRRSPPWREA